MAQTIPFAYLEKAIQTKANKLNWLIKKHYKREVKFSITYDLHSINALGTCRTPGLGLNRESHIRLNPALLNELKMAYVEEVFVHEFAHAAVDHVHNGGFNRVQPHGIEFKNMCTLFGIVGKSTTNIAKGSKLMKSGGAGQNNTVDYVCGCKDKIHKIGKVRHQRAQAEKSYICRGCGVAIWVKGTTQPTKQAKSPAPKKSNRQTFPYVCGCPNHVHDLTIIRHHKVLLEGARYRCRGCGENIWAKGAPKPTTPHYTFNIGT